MFASGSGKRPIVANFLTPRYRVVGTVHVGNSGLIGLLHDQNSSFLELSDVSMARIHEPRRLADRVDVVRMVKRGVVAIGVGRREDVGPQSIARGGFGRIAEYQVRAVTASYEFEGTLEYAGKFDLSAVLTEGIGEFIPLYDCKLRAIEYPDLNFESPALIFNRRKVDIITQLARQDRS